MLFKKVLIRSVCVCVISLSGCNYITGGSDNSEPPMSLSAFDAEKVFTELWSAKVGSGDTGQYLQLKPLILADKIITIDANGFIQATNPKDGQIIWQKNLKTKITQGVAGNKNKIFVSTDNGRIIALTATDGKELWQKEVNKNILNNPYVEQDNIYVQASDGSLYSLSTANGKVNWDYKMNAPDLTLYSTSSPVVWRDLVITGFANGRIAAFDKSKGTPVWELQVAMPKGQSSIQRMVDVNASPVIKDNFLYAVSYQGKAVAIDLVNGTKLWEYDLSSISDMTTSNKHLYISDTEGTVWALNRFNGRVLWKQSNLHMRKLSGTNYVDNTILVGDYAGYLHGLSTVHGDFIARTKFSSSGIRVAPIVKNGIIYVLDNSGRLAAYQLAKSSAAA